MELLWSDVRTGVEKWSSGLFERVVDETELGKGVRGSRGKTIG